MGSPEGFRDQLSSEYGVHASQIGQRPRPGGRSSTPTLSGAGGGRPSRIGKTWRSRLVVGTDRPVPKPLGTGLAQKKSKLWVEEKRALIEAGHPEIPTYRQCQLLGLALREMALPAGDQV